MQLSNRGTGLLKQSLNSDLITMYRKTHIKDTIMPIISRLAAACAIISVIFLSSCSETDEAFLPEKPVRKTTIQFRQINPVTRALDPDEEIITDLNVFVFNGHGLLEAKAYLTGASATGQDGYSWTIDLVSNARYSIYACANFGYRIDAGSINDLEMLEYYLAYPDDYSIGMPMSGKIENILLESDRVIVPMERLMAKISLSVDRSGLDEDVEFNIRSVKVEGCPRSVTPFSRNHISDPFDFFPSGFIRKDYETDILNTVSADGRSGEICLYMLENMQGDLLAGNDDEALKVLPEDDNRQALCSYIEIRSEYLSASHYSIPGEHLIYRFYPGENPGNFDIVRNCEYRICIRPKGSGLDGLDWRIDKSGIGNNPRELELSYSALTFSYIGEKTVIKPYITPGNMEEAKLYWDSDDKSVATVDGDGTVTARGEGKCTVFCHLADGSGVSAECTVTVRTSPYYMKIFPGNFIRCKKGDTVSISCAFYPEDSPFEIGIEELEYDKSRGIYDYSISEDGRSVTLYTKNRGSGLLYMETGYPVNQTELIVLVVD